MRNLSLLLQLACGRGIVAGRSTRSLGSMENDTPTNTGRAITVSRWWWRVVGSTLVLIGGLWLAFGRAFEILGGLSFAVAGLCAIVVSFARSGDVAADSAREIIQALNDNE